MNSKTLDEKIDLEAILDALTARENALNDPQHLDKIYASALYEGDEWGTLDRARAQAAVAAEKKMIEQGHALFKQGYRLCKTSRAVRSLLDASNVPADALIWRKIFAGHIATTEAARFAYVIKR